MTPAIRMRPVLPFLFLLLAVLACNLGAEPPGATSTPGNAPSQTLNL